MDKEKEICLLNDSFPPLIDGVANAVMNYARVLKSSGHAVCVATPNHPRADDSGFDYPVFRYPSVDLRKQIGYTAGLPLAPSIYNTLVKRDIGILHSHCPVMSNILACELRKSLDAPFIMTYHTKFDIDIANTIKLEPLRISAVKAIVDSVSFCDELWAVSRGAGENIKGLGYTGDYIVMPNGVDIERKKSPAERVKRVMSERGIPEDVPTFLFVGRLMWYKGIRLIIDALAALKSQDKDFRMVFIGAGLDENEIKSYAEETKIAGQCVFTGALRDREELAAWYSGCDLLLFPSTFDTNGLVVREAAACGLASVLIKDSAAAEGVSNGLDGYLVEENAASLAVCLAFLIDDRGAMRGAGERASENLYLSWDDSVKAAAERYETVKDNYRSGKYVKHRSFMEQAVSLHGDLLEALEPFYKQKKDIGSFFSPKL